MQNWTLVSRIWLSVKHSVTTTWTNSHRPFDPPTVTSCHTVPLALQFLEISSSTGLSSHFRRSDLTTIFISIVEARLTDKVTRAPALLPSRIQMMTHNQVLTPADGIQNACKKWVILRFLIMSCTARTHTFHRRFRCLSVNNRRKNLKAIQRDLGIKTSDATIPHQDSYRIGDNPNGQRTLHAIKIYFWALYKTTKFSCLMYPSMS